MNIKINNSEHQNICELYNFGLSSYNIAKKYNVCRKTICDILKKYIKKLNGNRGKRKKDESFFEKIDTQEKAYWLGFLYADGYNSGKGIVLSLQKSDINVVKKFKKDIKSDSKIYFITVAQMNRNSKNVQDLACLTVSSIKISKDLQRLGCFKKKSLILKFPSFEQVSHNLMSHFIRGYFDGDGCCCVTKHNGLFLSIASSEKFCNGIKDFLLKELNINCYKNNKKNNRSCTVYISGFNQIKKFYDYIYNNSKFYLKRKFEKFQEGFYKKEEKRQKFIKNKHSKYFGVTWHKRKNKWEAFSCKNGKTINLGSFINEKDAAKEYNKYAKQNNKPLNILLDKQ